MLFSVIVPVYGVESYLTTCVESILAQEGADFELILVDDGSKDDCPAICDAYAAQDDRIRVIHKPNGGLVSARKAGIAVANGDYIIQVDGDDWLEPGYFETAKKLIVAEDPDIITFAFNYAENSGKRLDRELLPTGLYTGDMLASITDAMLMTPNMRHMHYFLWAKVFRRNIIRDIQLGADEHISMGEDLLCVVPAYLRATRVYVSDAVVYNCRCRSDSMSRSYKDSHFDDLANGVRVLEGIQNSSPGYIQQVDRYAAFVFFVTLACAAETEEKSAIRKANNIYDDFAPALHRAAFEGITKKSKIALRLLKKRKIALAYGFLRLCGKLKGKS